MRILYATDGSKDCLAGAELLAQLPLEADAEIVLLTVLPEEGGEEAEAALGPAREALAHTTATITREVRRGAPAEEILRTAEEHPTDLVVLGSRGLHGIARFFLGSVAERVARHALCPVLVARPLAHGLQRVVVGVDGSECAVRAAAWIRRLSMPEGCEFLLLTVLPPREAALLSGDLVWPAPIPEIETLYEQEQQAAEARLAGLVRDFVAAGKRAVAVIETGDPANSTLQLAEERGADLIVVGSQGLTGIDRFILGSVSEKVMRYAHGSVLVVK
jgi:nucleotide-binding universal stress UspA family protein